jgi:hypothetical protein
MPRSLSLVFAFVHAFQHGEPGFFGVRDGQGLELEGRIEGGNNLANRFFAGGTVGQRRGGKRPAQREFPAADRTGAIAQFVLVNRHA